MKRRKRIYYTDTQKALMWDRWQQGEPLHQIASLFDRHHSSVLKFLAAHGGIRPPIRRRSPSTLSLALIPNRRATQNRGDVACERSGNNADIYR
ncbi:hypothetical protein FB548_2046 [Pseudoxanthomonas sp. 3HH-4]|nr:hypothetical protein FB548_2046 [Pseudoxanthomonas sp. 3HH-4]